ncbi:MAG TPA: type VI secretion system protein TssA [Acetobacteraceae bacterium]|nr:type VI secretion system protein TssA [Acetobacteraceae bacterium]
MVETAETGLGDLLARPIEGDAPAGEDLRLDVSPQSLYFRLRDARAEARAAERQADNDPAPGGAVPAQWATVRDLALTALTQRTKDIEIACWLTESLTRSRSLDGLADGVEGLVALIRHYWNQGLFPAPDEQDPEARLVAVTGMSGQDRDGSLLQPLRKVLLFTRVDGTPITFWEYERSRELAALGQADKTARAMQASVPFAELEIEARGHGRDALQLLAKDVARALAAWRSLEEVVAGVETGDAVPATGRVRALLERLNTVVERYVPAEAAVEASAADEPQVTPLAGAPASAALPQGRDALLDEILRISAVFRASEPNAPLSFTLDEAVRRARLSWPELLRELLPDVAARSAVLVGAGVHPPEE